MVYLGLSGRTIPRSNLFCCAIWSTWKDRNHQVHEQRSITTNDTVQFIKGYMAELDGVKEKRFTNGPEAVLWKAPPPSIIKNNFDGAFHQNTSFAALGVVARNDKGEVTPEKATFLQHIPSVFAAEAWACFLAIKTGIENGWRHPIVEGDAQSIIKKCKNETQDKSLIGLLIADIHRTKKWFHDIQFLFIPRSGNDYAHSVAKRKMKEEI